MIFGTIKSDSENATESLSILGKSIKDIVRDYRSVAFDKVGNKKVAAGLKGILQGGMTDSDISALKAYNNLILKNVDSTEAYSKTMMGASRSAQMLAKNSNGATVSLNTLTASEKAAAIGAKIMSVALNTALTLGLSFGVQALIDLIGELITAQERAKEEAIELRKSAVETVDNYKAESENLEAIRSKYLSLVSTTDNLTESKKGLAEIQKEINQQFKDQKSSIDAVNGSLETNLELMDEENYKAAKKAKEDIQAQYEEAVEQTQKGLLRIKLDVPNTISNKEFEKILDDIENIAFGDVSIGDRYHYGEVSLANNEKNMRTGLLPTYQEQLDVLDRIIETYGSWEDKNSDVYEQLTKQRDTLKEQYDDYESIISAYKEYDKAIQDYNSVTSEQGKQFNELLKQAIDLSQQFNKSDSTIEKYSIVQKLSDIKAELTDFAGDNTIFLGKINSTFSAIESVADLTIEKADDFHEAWFKALNDTEKNILKNVDTMKSALQSVANGDNLSSDTFWQLAEFDTDHILDGVRMIGDEFQLTEEQIIRLKDTYIQKQIESIQLRQTELEQLKKSEEMEIRQVQALLDKYSAMSLDAHNPNFAANRKAYDELNNRLSVAKENVKQYGEEWSLNAILLRQYNANLGNTSNLIQSAEERAKKLQENADKLSNAYVERIDSVIDGINEEKDALNEEKEALQDQLDILEAQADEIENIISEYEKVADIVKETIEEEISAIEETYNKQIEALKAQNEEREEAIDLTEKLNALNNAKNNKVVTYTEAGGFRYGVNKEAVNKAQNDYDKALLDSQISNLEKERDSATKDLEEYAKLWENATKKATKAEEEELATRILGADWRKKISEQDVEIFDTYQKKYDEYGVSLKRITDVEIANVKKSIDAKDKEIKAKEELLAEWQKYKNNVQKWVNDLKNANQDYADSLDGITLTESSNLDERLSNFETFKDKYMSIIDEIKNAQSNIGDIEVNASINAEGFTDGLSELVDGIGTVSEKLAEAIKELGKMPSINSAGDVKYYHATGYEHYASGGVNTTTGLAWLDGTKSRPEIILNNADATKLYNMLHSMPMSAVQMYTSPFVNTKSGGVNQSSTIQISGNTINLPNVQNPQQFAREMERYLQNTLTESQIIPPRK